MCGMRVCPRCGRREEENGFLEGFCPRCFPEVRELARGPESLELPECPRCGRVRLGGAWRSLDKRELEAWTLPKVKSRYEITSARAHLEGTAAKRVLLVELALDVEGCSFRHTLRIPAPVVKRLCEDDVRVAAGYFESILQFRGEAERVERFAERAARRTERLGSFVTKVERVKGGLDLYLGSNLAANQLVKELGVPFEASRSLGGVKKGKRVYRVTYLVRV